MLDNTNPKYDADFFTFPDKTLGLKITIPTVGQFVVCTPDHKEYFLATAHGKSPTPVSLGGNIFFAGLRDLDDAIAATLSVRVKWGWK